MSAPAVLAVAAVAAIALPAPFAASPQDGPVSTLDDDEQLLLATTAARPSADGHGWVVPLDAWVREPEDSVVRAGAIEQALDAFFDVEVDDESRPRFAARLAPFLADNERGERVVVRFFGDAHGHRLELPRTGADGHARTELHLPADDAARLTRDGELTLVAVLPEGDERVITGRVLLQGHVGLTVVSDIDDTVKLTGVGDVGHVLRRTFVEPFEAVPGMAALYRDWAARGAALHFVSSSPEPLGEALLPWLADEGFPDAVLHLQPFRAKDPDVFDLVSKGPASKLLRLGELLRAWPERRFILVGDTGERDPEIYAHAFTQHGDRIAAIALRNVTGAERGDERFGPLFQDVPAERWMLFTTPDGIRLPADTWPGR